jgi:hypothetical protein
MASTHFFESLADECDDALEDEFDEFEIDRVDDWFDKFDEFEDEEDSDRVGEIPSDLVRNLIAYLRLSWPYFQAYGYSFYAVMTQVLGLVRQGLSIRAAIQEARRQMHQEYQQKKLSGTSYQCSVTLHLIITV